MKYAVEIHNLNKIYSNGIVALKGVDLKVEIGDFYSLLGKNGAGKSTTIGIISSLIRKTSGKIKIFGSDIELDTFNVKMQIGVVPQEFNFSQFETVEQVITTQAGYYGIGRKTAFYRAEKYLSQLDLWSKRHEQSRLLSGGMKRRLMIARALIHHPKLLILDEPTAGVDVELRRSMWTFLKALNKKGTTIILTTHYIEEAEMLCRHIGIMRDGQIIKNTSIKSLLKQLQSETFILDFTKKIPMPYLPGFRYRLIDSTTIEVEVTREQGLNRLFKYLSMQGVEVLSMRNKSSRLEEFFVSLVQKREKLL
ncbi:ABC transporter ATP-binding protein [Candidatus Ishikawella capsulata]|uniref:Predicted transporter subunit n=1 Tax=Candidatus Ishikawaella capsulata Mpkobe TaxID=476281 RepID=C5WCM1_9ENTR|nr:ABC transporter ATP-binding protein [Candidatus Ishikawaella capsulata]BAH83077.1 predicted transporter subunit [Candidatus Ishikawaella capsulata Mpkobe]